ncbi:MAG TPA: SBBP repeat-containing protein [Bryobacteraceae bacterium]|nr:SBBP repeat-containing protein [Bryobacteraceae bacterium]
MRSLVTCSAIYLRHITICGLAASIAATVPSICRGQAGVITTVAGGGTLTGSAANGRPATSVRLMGNALGVAVDNAGNFYIADGRAARVWKVSAAGILTTAAGGGAAPGSGDGGPATNAQITVSGVAVDTAGNLYIAGARLRKVSPAGVISTLADINATNVAVDGAGNLYLADILNHRIRKVDPAGVITDLAGSGAQGFSGDGGPATSAALFLPQGVAADAQGNVYFADAGNGRVRKVDTAGIITTVAGSGSPLSLGDGGPATRAGMTPTFVAVDNEGNLYIADTGSGRIRKVNTAGNISTVAGGAPPANPNLGDGGPATSAWLSGPRGVAVDNAGNIFISDDNNARIRKVSSGAAGSPIQATPAALSFSYTAGGSLPPGQTVVIFSPGASLIFSAAASTASGGSWLSVSPVSGSVGTTLTITVNPSGLAPGAYTGAVTLAPSGTGNTPQTIPVTLNVNAAGSQAVITTVAGNGFGPIPFTGEGGPATSATLGPNGVAVDGAGNFYISVMAGNRVLKVDTAGIITTLAGNGAYAFAGDGGPGASASLFSPGGVAADNAGNVYIADTINNRIRKVNTAGLITTVAGNGTMGFGGDGGPATNASLSSPLGVALDSAGNLYIADASRVRKVNSAGIITNVAGTLVSGFSGDGGPAASASVFLPSGVTVDAAGNIYIADVGNSRIRRVNTAGIINTIAGNGTKGFSGDGGPATSASLNLTSGHMGMAADSAGNLYIPDVGNHRIRKVDRAGVITTVAGTGIGGFSGDGGPAITAGLNNPTGVALNSSGDMYVADTTNLRVRKIAGAAGQSPSAGVCLPSIVNGASFQPGISPNSWATMQGCVFASTVETWDKFIVDRRLPVTLGGVSVNIGGKPAFLYYVSPDQINLVVPDVEPGPVQVSVTTASGRREQFMATISAYSPAFFLWPANQPVATRQDFSFAAKANTFSGAATVPAKPGEVVILWGTGFGPTAPPAPIGVQLPTDRTFSTSTLPVVSINNIPATVFGAALAPGFVALYQVAIQVPASLPDGDWPVRATVAGAASQAGAVLSVRR